MVAEQCSCQRKRCGGQKTKIILTHGERQRRVQDGGRDTDPAFIEGRWTKSPGRGYKKWTDSVEFGERFHMKEAKGERASATVATMATREQVQKALQRPQARGEGEATTPVRKKEGARSRGAMPSSFAKSTKTNEQKKVSSSTQWLERCTQPRTARFTRRREREMKSELFEAEKSLLGRQRA